MLKDVLMSQYLNNIQLRCSELFDSYLQYDDNKVMKSIRRLFGIYSLNTQKCKMHYLLKWSIQKERIVCCQYVKYFKKSDHIPHNKQSMKKSNIKDNEIRSNIKDNEIRSIKEYSRNVNLLKKSHSVVNSKMDYENYSNSLSMNVAQVDSFSLSKRNYCFRLNSKNHCSYSTLKHEKDKDRRNNRSSRPMSKSQSMINQHERKTQPLKKTKQNKNPKEKPTKEDKNKFFNSLHETSTRFRDNLRKLELEKETKFNKECTFKPILYKSKSNIKLSSVPFISRLHNYEQIRSQKFNNLREEIESQLPKPLSNPSLTSRSKDAIVSEIKAYTKKKKEKLRQIELNLYKEKGITFKPMLNDDKNKAIRDTVTIRNKNFIEMRDEKLNRICSKEVPECTFVPSINIPLIEDKPEANNNVCIRLYDYKNRYEANREYIKKYYEVNYSFKPAISKNTEKILMNKQQKKNISLKRQRENDLKVISERQAQDQEKYEDEDDKYIPLYKIKNQSHQNTSNKTQISFKPNKENNNLLKISVASLSDERTLDLAKMYLSVDNSLEQFQKKMLKAKQYSCIIKEKHKDSNHKTQFNINQHNNKKLMKHLDYYDLLN